MYCKIGDKTSKILENAKVKLFEKSHGVYAAGEMKIMTKFQKWKDSFFAPLMRLLTKCGVSASVISILGVLIAISGLFLSITYGNPRYFVVAIWIHFFLDGLDGSLARYQYKMTLRGMFIDTACDLTGVIACSEALYYFHYISAQSALFFTALYVLVTIMALVLGAVNTPYPFIVRPRLFVFISLTIDIFSGTAFSTPLVEILTVILSMFCIQGFLLLGKHLNRHFA